MVNTSAAAFRKLQIILPLLVRRRGAPVWKSFAIHFMATHIAAYASLNVIQCTSLTWAMKISKDVRESSRSRTVSHHAWYNYYYLFFFLSFSYLTSHYINHTLFMRSFAYAWSLPMTNSFLLNWHVSDTSTPHHAFLSGDWHVISTSCLSFYVFRHVVFNL